jgi:hypothetical protein
MNHGLVIALLIFGGGLAAHAQSSVEQQKGLYFTNLSKGPRTQKAK